MKTLFVQVVFLPLVTVYLAFNFIPAQWFWFEPSTPVFSDVPSNGIPALDYTRVIKIDTRTRYTVVVRRIGPESRDLGDGYYEPPGEVMCEGSSQPYTYRAQSGPVVGHDLSWWVPQDFRCRVLPDGLYWAETCWTLTNPLGDLMNWYLGTHTTSFLGPFAPKKTICEISRVFRIGPVSE